MARYLSHRPLIAVAAGLCVTALAGCGSTASTSTSSKSAAPSPFHATSHVLQYPLFDPLGWPHSVDPATSGDTQSQVVVSMLYGNLVKLDSANRVIPDLARSWAVSPDRTAYTFTLRQTRFSDGKPVTAADVVYSIDRVLSPHVDNGNPSPVATTYLGHIVGAGSYTGKGDVAGVKALGPRTVRITLDRPIAYFLPALSYTTADIVEKGTAPRGLSAQNPLKDQVSSGPWRLAAYRYKSSLTLVPNPGYYNYHHMKLTRVEMPVVADDQTMYQGYESGQFAMTVVSSDRLAAADTEQDFHASPALVLDYIPYNLSKPPFNNRSMRLAATYAIDRDRINNLVLHGYQKTIYSIVPDGLLGYDAAGKAFVPHYDPTLARTYLALAKKQLGASFPRTLTIKYQPGVSEVAHEYAELQYEWRQVGLNVTVEASPNEILNKPSPSLAYTGADPWTENLWADDYPDAVDFTTNLLGPTSVYNIGDYNNPRFNALISQAETATGTARARLYIAASRLALNDVAWSVIGQQTNDFRWSSHITGLVLSSGFSNPEPIDNDWTAVDVR